MFKKKDRPLPDDKNTLLSEIESLRKQIYRLQLENDKRLIGINADESHLRFKDKEWGG